MKLINYYNNKQNEVILKYVNEDGTKQFQKVKYTPYFWVKNKDAEETILVLNNLTIIDKYTNKVSTLSVKIGNSENGFTKILYTDSSTIYLRSIINSIVATLDNKKIKHFEADIFPSDLWMLDNPQTEISEDYDILYYDIETDDRQGGVEIGRDRILSICGIDNKGNKFEFINDSETQILQDFTELVGMYDIIIGWNSTKFDLPYIKQRLLKNGMYFSFKSTIHIDLMKVFMESFAVSHTFGKRYIESFALDYIARAYLDDKKLEIENTTGYGGRIYNLYVNDKKKLLAYNMQDCVLLKKLNEKFHLIQNEIELAKYIKFPLSKTRSASSIVDKVLLRECRKIKIHWKTASDVEDKPHQSGGAVLDSIPGLHKNINIYDFASLYPNIFRVFNISPDTVLDAPEEDCITLPNNIQYTNKFIGFVPRVLDKLTTLRLKYKGQKIKCKETGDTENATLLNFKETAIKVIILSIYGIMGAPFSRFFDIRVANSVTETGQALTTTVAKNLDKNGFTVVGGDTDSVFFQINDESKRPEVDKIIQETIDGIIKSTNTHRENTLIMGHEKTLKTFLVLSKDGETGAKKKYAGRCIWDDGYECDNLYFRGIELHKSSELKITKQFLEEVLRYSLWNEPEIKELENIIVKYKKKILSKKVEPDEITIVKKVGKMVEDYKNLPEHVRLAKEKFDKEGEYFYVGQKVPHIVISNNPMKVIHKRDFKGEFDEKYYWEIQMWGPVYRAVKTMFPKYYWERHKEGSKMMQTALFDFV